MRHLVFDVSGVPCALRVERVREVVEPPPVTRVPGSPRALRGLVHLRGGVAAVVDLAVRLGLPPRTGGRPCLVVVQHDPAGSCALLVDGVPRIAEGPGHRILPPPATPLATEDLVAGFLERHGLLALLLNLDRVLDVAAIHANGPALDPGDPQRIAVGTSPRPGPARPVRTPLPPPAPAPARASGGEAHSGRSPLPATPKARAQPTSRTSTRERQRASAGSVGGPREVADRRSFPPPCGPRPGPPVTRAAEPSGRDRPARTALTPTPSAPAAVAGPSASQPFWPVAAALLVAATLVFVALSRRGSPRVDGATTRAPTAARVGAGRPGPLAPLPRLRLPEAAPESAAGASSPRVTVAPSSAGAPLAPPAAPAPAGGARTYEVAPGDTLWSISRRELGSPYAWRRLHEANRSRIPDPDVIEPGWRLALPGSSPRDPREP